MVEYQDVWNGVRDELEEKLAPRTFDQTFGEVKKELPLSERLGEFE